MAVHQAVATQLASFGEFRPGAFDLVVQGIGGGEMTANV